MRPVVLAVVGLQIAVPLTALGARWADEGTRPTTERPASWQMYSSTARPAYDGLTADGASRPVRVDDLAVGVRAVGTGRLVPQRLCALDPALVAVRRTGGPDPGTFRC